MSSSDDVCCAACNPRRPKMLLFNLCFSCAFRRPAQRAHNSNRGKRSVYAAAAKPLITLLNFAAGQRMELRIVAIVTILQQLVAVRSAPAAAFRKLRPERSVRIVRNKRDFANAEWLGKRWRFFATYADV